MRLSRVCGPGLPGIRSPVPRSPGLRAPTTPAQMTHDYVRHGTTSLFSAYDVAGVSGIAQSYRRHRHQEFLRFLKVIDQAVPKGLDLHLVLDNYATHKTPAIHQWLPKRPRFHLHFTPTSSSWLNLVERTSWRRSPTIASGSSAPRISPADSLREHELRHVRPGLRGRRRGADALAGIRGIQAAHRPGPARASLLAPAHARRRRGRHLRRRDSGNLR